MKKILTLLTGIVFLIAILIAGACRSDEPKGPKEVYIYLMKASEQNGTMHLKMYDSNDTTIVIVDTLVTDVQPGTKVIWTFVKDSGIKKVEKIGPKNGSGNKIIKRDATRILFTKKFKLKIPKDAPIPSEREKYDIVFVDKGGNTWKIDPYLRIPNLDVR
jgi:hypothetical protein